MTSSIPFIDLYADTKSKPTNGMRQAIASAIVGDEQKDEDPTVLALCSRVASLLGKESALWLPSGTMANQIALQVHCRPSDEVICDKTAHVAHFEGGGPGSGAGVMFHLLDGKDGIYEPEQLEAALERRVSRYTPLPRLVWVEQTANLGGGTIWPLETLQRVGELAHGAGLKTHMDGARLLNAVVASGVSAADFAAPFDSVWIDFTKGLGCPVGAVLAGSKAFVEQAWRVKQRVGGAMRQAGIVAAAALYALDHHVERLAVDHANAAILADGLDRVHGFKVLRKKTMTNIVFVDIEESGVKAAELVEAAKANGVGVGEFGKSLIRVVTYLDVTREDVQLALNKLEETVTLLRSKAASSQE